MFPDWGWLVAVQLGPLRDWQSFHLVSSMMSITLQSVHHQGPVGYQLSRRVSIIKFSRSASVKMVQAAFTNPRWVNAFCNATSSAIVLLLMFRLCVPWTICSLFSFGELFGLRCFSRWVYSNSTDRITALIGSSWALCLYLVVGRKVFCVQNTYGS